MRVSKWGNSLAVRLPAGMVEDMQLKEGDEIELINADRDTFIVERYDDPAAMLQRIRRFRGRLPERYVFDRDDAHAR